MGERQPIMGEPERNTTVGVRRSAEPEVWLTAGEAADAAGVTHRQLQAWIAAETLQSRTGWRGAAEIRLVALTDLKELAEAVDLSRIREALEERGVFTGPRHMRLGSPPLDGALALDGDVEPSTPQPGAPPPGAVDPARLPEGERSWAIELNREIGRLRGVISTLREDHESLERHLDDRVAVVRTRVLDGSSLQAAPVVTPLRAASSFQPRPLDPERTSPEPRRGSAWAGAFAVALGLVLGAGSAKLLGGQVDASERVLTGPRSVAALIPSPSPAPSPVPALGPLRSSRSDPSPALSPAPARGAAQEQYVLMGPPPPPIHSASAFVESPARDQAITSPESTAQPSSSDRLGAAKDERPPGPAANPPAADAPAATAPTRLQPPVSLAQIDPRQLPAASQVLADCAYAGLVSGTQAEGDESAETLLLALGPCYGRSRASSTAGAGLVGSQVPGTHRVGDVACCRHHAFVERMTQAATDRQALEALRAEALASRQEGLVPPLLRLRAERAAGRFLRYELGSWERAGLDGVPAGEADAEHVWSLIEPDQKPAARGAPVRLRLQSWVLTARSDEASAAKGAEAGAGLRSFTLELTLQATHEGDRLDAFAWLPR